MSILSDIILNKKKEIDELKKRFPIDCDSLGSALSIRNFEDSIKRKDALNLIAEIKKKSPSSGIIRENFDPVLIAKQYKQAGASALSILTDNKFFEGDLSYIRLVKDQVDLPILRKDFIIDEYQIYETLSSGADAILLIADILSLDQLKDYVKIASGFNLSCLVEAHNEDSIKKSIDADAKIIGINNRDLNTFEIDLNATSRLTNIIPDDKIIVSESGIKNFNDIKYLESFGIDAVLIGETFIKDVDIVSKVKEVMGY